MIRTQSVTAFATVEGSDFRLTNAEVDRTTGRTAAQATVKGIVEDIDTLEAGNTVRVYIAATNGGEEPTESAIVFAGKAQTATQNEQGLVEVTAFDTRYKLHNKNVAYAGEEEELSWNVLSQIINELFPDTTTNRSAASLSVPYIAPRSAFPQGDNRGLWDFERSQSVTDALQSLVASIGGYVWVDRRGVLTISPYPDPNTDWTVPFITKLNAGDDAEQASRVLFESSSIASEYGLGAASVYQERNTPSEALLGGDDSEPLPPEITISDQNTTTAEEADSQAYREGVNKDQQRDMGEVTIVGNSDIELFDHAIIPDLDFEIGGIERPIPNDLQSGRFKIDAITHTINAQDGFLTRLELSPAINSSYQKCRVPASDGISTRYLEQYENTVTEEKISGVDDSSGFALDFTF